MVYKIAEEENDFNVMAMLIDFMNKMTLKLLFINAPYTFAVIFIFPRKLLF